MIRISDVLARRMERIRKGEKASEGFTLIELLVVIIIIGILAAIAIPVFMNQRTSAWKSSIQSDVHSATLSMETYGTANSGSYTNADEVVTTTSTPVAPKPVFKVSDGNTVTIAVAKDGNSYTITGTNKNVGTGTGNTYNYDSSTGKTSWS